MGLMKVQKHTGLVAIKLLKPVDNYKRGKIHGFVPAHARTILKGGDGVKAAVPDGVLYTEVFDGIGDDVTEKAAPREPTDMSAPARGNADPGSVAIPPDWETRNHFANIATAKQITGDPTAKMLKVDAERIITEELARREAAGQ